MGPPWRTRTAGRTCPFGGGVRRCAVRGWCPQRHQEVCRVPEDHVKLRLRFKESEDLPEAEGMWAQPVDAHDGGGTYRLANTSFFVALATGDTVRAALDGHGALQIVDIVAPCDRVLTVTEHA